MGVKKYLLLGALIPTLLLVGCGNGYKKGDTFYNGMYEVIKIINENEKMYEVRDTETGVHYIFDYYDDTLCPYYINNKEVKQTVINEKYKDKE